MDTQTGTAQSTKEASQIKLARMKAAQQAKAAAEAAAKAAAEAAAGATRNALIRQIITVELRCADDSSQLTNSTGGTVFTVANTTAHCATCNKYWKVRKSMFDVVR